MFSWAYKKNSISKIDLLRRVVDYKIQNNMEEHKFVTRREIPFKKINFLPSVRLYRIWTSHLLFFIAKNPLPGEKK